MFLGTIKLITWQPISFYNLSRHLTEGRKRELLQHKARCRKASQRQQGFGPSEAPTHTSSSVDMRCPFPSLYRDPSAVTHNQSLTVPRAHRPLQTLCGQDRTQIPNCSRSKQGEDKGARTTAESRDHSETCKRHLHATVLGRRMGSAGGFSGSRGGKSGVAGEVGGRGGSMSRARRHEGLRWAVAEPVCGGARGHLDDTAKLNFARCGCVREAFFPSHPSFILPALLFYLFGISRHMVHPGLQL